MVKDVVPPMHAAGRPFVAGALTFGLFGWRSGWARRTSLVAAGALALCFREPKRVAPAHVGAVVAPADGVVVDVAEAVPPQELGLGDAPLPRVSIRASVLDPYVLRIPLAGRVADLAGDGSTVVLEISDDVVVGLVQTATTLAGRITCDVRVDQEVQRGDTYALVRFGSRVDVYLPTGTEIGPLEGQRTVGGETVLAVLG
jgi:phosphatidylserine decarboxylase